MKSAPAEALANFVESVQDGKKKHQEIKVFKVDAMNCRVMG